MRIREQTLVRVSDLLIIAGASTLFITAIVIRLVGEAAGRPVFAALCAAFLGGLWLRGRLDHSAHMTDNGPGDRS